MARPAGLTPDDIVDAAVALADKLGFYDITLAGVAAELGVRPPSLYHHIDGVDGIRRAIVRRAVRHLADTLEASRDGQHGAEAFVAHAHALRRMAHEHPGLYTAVNATRYISDDEEMWAALIDAAGPLTDCFRELGLRDDDVVWEAVRLFRATIHGFLVLERRGEFSIELDPDPSYDNLVEVLLTGFRAKFT